MFRALSILIGATVATCCSWELQAFPITTVTTQVATTELMQVRDFCGLGFHRSPYGYCVRNGVPYGYVAPVVVGPAVVAPPVVVAPRVCPYGYVYAPAYGRCVRI
jgi:hypothetical protein